MRVFALACVLFLVSPISASAMGINLKFRGTGTLSSYEVSAIGDQEWFAVAWQANPGTTIAWGTGHDTPFAISFLSHDSLHATITAGFLFQDQGFNYPAGLLVDIGVMAVSSPMQGGALGTFGPGASAWLVSSQTPMPERSSQAICVWPTSAPATKTEPRKRTAETHTV